jgi:hypothetical protein
MRILIDTKHQISPIEGSAVGKKCTPYGRSRDPAHEQLAVVNPQM